MIKEQRVGIRVRVIECGGIRYSFGDTGTIVRVDGDDCPLVNVDGKGNHFITDYKLTEIKEDNMYLDEALKVVREDENMEFSWGDKGKWFDLSELLINGLPSISYPNESGFTVRAKKPAIKEVTVAELEEKYGCKVKVINR